MNDQIADDRSHVRWLLGVLTLSTTAVFAWASWHVLSLRGAALSWSIVLTVLFVALFLCIAMSFWIATAGLIRRVSGSTSECRPATSAAEDVPLEVRTAILMPVYNESPHRVFAGLRAIHESLQGTGQGAAFDFFVLSDTTDPDLWLAEELAWAALNRTIANDDCRIYYRHRSKNIGRKSGNIADFCQRWGAGYRYMVVLDADSVMSGETIVELVRRMEQDQQIGILQSPPVPVNRGSLFARCQQFASAVYGPVFLEGFAWWTGSEGNYWGHNAIIRLDAFTKACGLPKVPGDGPLSGEILSHDFVEAALIRRAGLKVCMAHDLGGSYEECPPTLLDFAQRDQRWCQGNLQHLRLISSAGIHPVSRFHLSMGAMSYLSSPLWLLSLILSLLTIMIPRAAGVQPIDPTIAAAANHWAIGLFAATMALLLLPKLWGYLALLADRPRLAKCGGAWRAACSVGVETLVSMLVAPILMLFHSTFVITTLLGQRVQWNAQERNESGQSFRPALAAHWRQTAAGLAAGSAVWVFAPETLFWTLPVLVGLILAIPLSILLSSAGLGQSLARRGLLLIPEETATPAVLTRHHHFLSLGPAKELADLGGMFRRVLTDPAVLALHRSILEATDAAVPSGSRAIGLTQRQLLSGGPWRVSAENRKAVLSDPQALEALHLFVWTTHGSPAKG